MNLDALKADSRPFSSHVSTENGVYEVDVSAVLKDVNPEDLMAASLDYEAYPQMGVRQAKQGIIFKKEPHHYIVWMKTRAAGQISENYLEVRVLNSLTIPKAQAIEWQQIPALADWPYPDNSSFSTLDGSWFVQDLGAGEVYVRYFMAATLDTGFPEFLIRGIAQRELEGAALEVVEVLAHQAKSRR